MSSVKKPVVNKTTQKIWNFFMKFIQNPYGVAALMGNLYGISGLKSNYGEENLNYNYVKRTDENLEKITKIDEPTIISKRSVNKDGEISYIKMRNFVRSTTPYGIAGWKKRWTAKQTLWNLCYKFDHQLNDLTVQMSTIWDELETAQFHDIFEMMKESQDLRTLTDMVHMKYFENESCEFTPEERERRYQYADFYYNTYGKNSKVDKEYVVSIARNSHIRTADTSKSKSVGVMEMGKKYEFVTYNAKETWYCIKYEDHLRWVYSKNCRIVRSYK